MPVSVCQSKRAQPDFFFLNRSFKAFSISEVQTQTAQMADKIEMTHFGTTKDQQALNTKLHSYRCCKLKCHRVLTSTECLRYIPRSFVHKDF